VGDTEGLVGVIVGVTEGLDGTWVGVTVGLVGVKDVEGATVGRAVGVFVSAEITNVEEILALVLPEAYAAQMDTWE